MSTSSKARANWNGQKYKFGVYDSNPYQRLSDQITNAHPLEIELENLSELKRQWKKHVPMPKGELSDDDWMDLFHQEHPPDIQVEEKWRPNRGRNLVKKGQQEGVRNGTKNGHYVHGS
jgi:hypothetical protein